MIKHRPDGRQTAVAPAAAAAEAPSTAATTAELAAELAAQHPGRVRGPAPFWPFEAGADSLTRTLRSVVGLLLVELDGGRLEVEARGNVVRAVAELRDAIRAQEDGPADPAAVLGHVSLPAPDTGARYELTLRGRLALASLIAEPAGGDS